MSAVEHDHESLGAYTLDALAPDEARAVEAHLAECADCRREVAELTELRGMLDTVPQEAFLDGPPDDGELLLQRTAYARQSLTALDRVSALHDQPVVREFAVMLDVTDLAAVERVIEHPCIRAVTLTGSGFNVR